MTKIDPVEEIKKLGLNDYEARVYLALMERDTLSASEVSKLSQVPRVRTYDILDKLVGRGLASLKPGKHMKYSAIDFSALNDKLIDEVERRFNEEKSTIEKVTVTLKRQFEQTLQRRNHNEHDSLDYIEIIKDYYQIHTKFMELVGGAETEILNFVKPPFSKSQPSTSKERAGKEVSAISKGVTVKVIYEIPTVKEEVEWRYHDIANSIKDGEHARVIKELPLKMAVFDRKIVMLSLLDPISNYTTFTAQLVEHAALADAFRILFETLWDRADEYHVLKEIYEKM